MIPTITAFKWVPAFARGFVRDIRVRWAFEEAGQAYEVNLVNGVYVKSLAHRLFQPFGQIPTYRDDKVEIFELSVIVLYISRGGTHACASRSRWSHSGGTMVDLGTQFRGALGDAAYHCRCVRSRLCMVPVPPAKSAR